MTLPLRTRPKIGGSELALPRYRERIIELSRIGLGWEDIAKRLQVRKDQKGIVRDIYFKVYRGRAA